MNSSFHPERVAAIGKPDPELEAIRGLGAAITDAHARIDAGRELPADLLETLHRDGLWRLALPRTLDGRDWPPRRLARATEIIAAADASVAWCPGQGAGAP